MRVLKGWGDGAGFPKHWAAAASATMKCNSITPAPVLLSFHNGAHSLLRQLGYSRHHFDVPT